MRAALISLTLAAALMTGSAASAAARPNAVCPQLRRTPVAHVADLPKEVRQLLGAMADPGGRWNVSDAIGPGQTHLPFRRLIAAGDMGSGRWLVVWEQGGFAHFNNVEIYNVITNRAARTTANVAFSAKGAQLPALCAQVAAQLR